MAEILSRLNPKTSSFAPSLGRSRSIDDITPEILSASLAGLERGPYLLARAIFVGDQSVVRELECWVTVMVASKILRRSDLVRPGFDFEIASLAVKKVIDPEKCSKCSGRGQLHTIAGAVVECTVCTNGLAPRSSARAMAKQMRVGIGTYKAIESRYHKIETMLWQWRGRVVGHVRRQLLD